MVKAMYGREVLCAASCSLDFDFLPVHCRKSKPSELQLRKGALFWRAPHPCLARAPLPISLASRITAAAPLLRRPFAEPLVSRRRRAARAAALVTRASRALVSRERRAARSAALVARAPHAEPRRPRSGAALPSPMPCAATLVARASRADSTLASRGRRAAALVAAELVHRARRLVSAALALVRAKASTMLDPSYITVKRTGLRMMPVAKERFERVVAESEGTMNEDMLSTGANTQHANTARPCTPRYV